MSGKNDKELDRLRKNVQNAMNRTLTKVKREQSSSIISRLALTKKKINFLTTHKRASPNDMNIKIFTFRKQITPTMLPRKATSSGVVVSLNKQKSITLAGFAEQKPRDGGGKFLITSKTPKNSDFSISRHLLKSSYKTSHGTILSKPREAFIAKKLDDDLAEYALKDINKLLAVANDIFTEELNK
ncbi:hypothetical protein [Campylobacter sp. RM16187]|uniref:hypothetical protein n=1 Tax=Campylobacter sp. RM16187 TaxID=1660063 RepID=UPI0021B619FD|nr:hypothetical protein [Campylobacter sp. RM16187]QKG29171.1 hypothetical protein CDOMF_0907 [Campylobacter sp. RM16187]